MHCDPSLGPFLRDGSIKGHNVCLCGNIKKRIPKLSLTWSTYLVFKNTLHSFSPTPVIIGNIKSGREGDRCAKSSACKV